MFTLDKSGTVWATIKGDEISEDGKRRIPFEFAFRFRRMSLDGFSKWANHVREDGLTDIEGLLEVGLEFRDLKNADGSDAEFNADTLAAALSWVGVEAFLVAMKATLPRAKNS